MRKDEWDMEVGYMGVVVGGDTTILDERDAAVYTLESDQQHKAITDLLTDHRP